MKRYDLVVVGSGSGLNVLEAALAEGWTCALVERGPLGGTCLTRGCIPSKVLTAPADDIRRARDAAAIGLRFEAPAVDWGLVSRRVWSRIDESRRIEANLAAIRGLDVYRGTAEFTGPRRLRVRSGAGPGREDELESARVLLATGARPAIPPIEGLESAGYVTSDTFFGERWPASPWESVAIVGGGLLAVEFAHVFSAFGTRVTVLEQSARLLGSEEPEVSALVGRELGKVADVRLGCRVTGVRAAGGRKTVRWTGADGATGEVAAAEVFVAAGRVSNADALSPAAGGVETGPAGWIRANPRLETTAPGVWAIGDAIGGFQFRHKANYDAEICVHNLFSGHEKAAADYSAVPWAVFTWPQVGHVGLTEADAVAAGKRAFVAVNPYSATAKGFALGYDPDGEPGGFAKVVADENGRILGAHVVGPEAALLVQPFVYLMNTRYECPLSGSGGAAGRRVPLTVPELEGGTFLPIRRSMVIHPSLNEVTAWALGNFRPARSKGD